MNYQVSQTVDKCTVSRRITSSLPPWVRRVGQVLTVLNLSLTVSSHPVWAMPVPNSDGTGTLVNVNGNQFDITGGTRSGDGQNLFHSFERLNLDANQVVNFVSQPQIQNILGRINGGAPSIIDGVLQVSGGNSNLFLLNPSGILFGNNATLNVPAAFNASTADGIQFGNGWFSATGANIYSALNGAPIGFAFANAQPSAIVNAGDLTVNAGQDLSLLGGTVVSTGQLSAPGGEITVNSIPGSRYVRLSQPGQLLSLEVLPLSESAAQPNAGSLPTTSLPHLLTGAAPMVATGVEVAADGSVVLTGADISVETGDVTLKTAAAGTAAVSATNNLSLFESQIQTADDLRLVAGNMLIARDSISSAVNIRSDGNLTVQGNRGMDISALNFNRIPDFISGGSLDLISDGLILADASFQSQGDIAFLTRDKRPGNFINDGQTMLQSSGVVDLGDYSGASLLVEANGSIRAGNITVTHDANLESAANILAEDLRTLNNFPALILRAGLTEPASILSVGDITVYAGEVELASNGNIFTGEIDVRNNANYLARQGPGNISLNAFNIFTGNLRANLIPEARTGGLSGASGGRVTIEADGLLRTGNIDTYSLFGNGGDVTITASDAIVGNINTSGSFGGVLFLTELPSKSLLSQEAENSSVIDQSALRFKGGDVTITTNAPLQVGTISVNGGRPGTITITELGLPMPEEPEPPAPEEEEEPPIENPVEPPAEDDSEVPTEEPDEPTGGDGEIDIPAEEPSSPLPDGEGDGVTPEVETPISDGEGDSTPESSGGPIADGGEGTDEQEKAVPNLEGLGNFTLTDAATSDPADQLPEISPEELERVRNNRLKFLQARRLAGQKMTTQEIASLLDIPLSVAELAVLMPVGNEIGVPIPYNQDLQDDVPIAGLDEGTLDWTCIFDPTCVVAVGVVTTVVVVVEGGKLIIRVVDKSGKVIVEKTGEAAEAIHRHFFPAKEKRGKKGATDIPSWAKGKKPRAGESGKDFAKRVLDERYGEGNWNKTPKDRGPKSEFNRLKKYGDRHF